MALSDNAAQPDDDAPDDSAPVEQGRIRGLSVRVLAPLKGMLSWSTERPWRSAVIGASLLLTIVGTLAGWIYLSSLAAEELSIEFDDAFQAWDQREMERATEIVRKLQSQSGFEESFGSALFILGAVKSQVAEEQWSAVRRRTEYLIASRYLEEALAYGIQPEREGEGLYLLGKSLVESHQLSKAVDTLNEALQSNLSDMTPVHALLARAHFHAPDPELEETITHLSFVLDDAAITPDDRANSLLMKADALTRQKKYNDALAALQAMPADVDRKARIELQHGQTLLAQATQAVKLTADQADQASPTIATQITDALGHLQAAHDIGRDKPQIAHHAMYLIGRAHRLKGDVEAAMRHFTATRKARGTATEGLAAMLDEAELLQASGENEPATQAYRRILESIKSPDTYQNSLIPLSELRSRLNAAMLTLVDNEQFENALAIIEQYTPLFDPIIQAEQQAQTYERWSDRLINEKKATVRETEEQWRTGQLLLRQAGTAYERLSKMRFATRRYPDDLWKSADCYFRGQSYSSAARILDEYLRHEPELRNPAALLRLSQSYLAMDKIDESIAVLEECIEFHPRDETVYQARIDLSRSYRKLGDQERAEELLLDNLTRSRLTPRSPEWRDSLYAMGSLLHSMGRYDEAINYLERYAKRLEQSRQQFEDVRLQGQESEFQSLSADYLIGDSHRLEAADPLDQLRAAASQSERDHIRKTVFEELQMAEQKFNEVVIKITTRREGYRGDPVLESMLRNSYMLLGSVLFDQGKYRQASEVYSNVSSLYQHEPFVLETYVQIAHCWRRMNQPEKARGMIESAQFVLNQLPPDAKYLEATSFTRDEWQSLINEMATW